MILLIQMLMAHMLGDFFLQPNHWVRDKEQRKWRSPFLYWHVLIHFVLLILLTGSLNFWKPALFIASSHLIIDAAKLQFQKTKTKRAWFFIDQCLHIGILLAIWIFIEKINLSLGFLSDRKIMIPMAGILFILNPASVIIKTIVSKWAPGTFNSSKDMSAEDAASLQNAGRWIGMMERLLVLIFIFLGKWEGIGFLLAAKSVFRFGDLKDAKDMKLTEYVLIGTFLSFGIAIGTGILVMRLVSR